MNKDSPPKITVDPRSSDSEGYVARGRRWSTNDLIEASKDLKPFKVALASIDISIMPWKVTDFDDVLFHIKRISEVDQTYPIIFDAFGCICNGYHRIAKAMIEGETTIMAIRLQQMPRSERVKEGPPEDS